MLGIIAGKGKLPHYLIKYCQVHQKNFMVFPLCKTIQWPEVPDQNMGPVLSLGKVEQSLRYFRAAGITDLVFIGALQRPSLKDLKLDQLGRKWILKLGWKAFGDDGLLQGIGTLLEQEGFQLLGIQDVLPHVTCPPGLLTKRAPSLEDWKNIRKGAHISQVLGRLDIGHSVIMQEEVVLALEAIEGTQQMMERSRDLCLSDAKICLVKTCKPQQTKKIDLPVIGKDTVDFLVKLGAAGAAFSAGTTLIIDIEEIIKTADANGLFLYGLSAEEIHETCNAFL